MRWLLILTVSSLVCACGQVVKSQYTKFDNLPESVETKTIVFAPLENQKGSVAWNTYAQQIADELLKTHGMRRVSLDQKADYLAFFDYGVSGSRTEVVSIPIYGQTGGGVSTTSGSVYGSGGLTPYYSTTTTQPTYGIVGVGTKTRNVTDRFFQIKILDAAKSTVESPIAVYEGQIVSSGSNNTFESVGNCMIKSLVEDFRGSGTSTGREIKANC